MRLRGWVVGLSLPWVLACGPRRPSDALPDPQLRRDLELTPEQATYLQRLADAADRAPDDFQAHKASGLAHMRFTLSGVLSLQERAEADLEAAFALDPTDRLLTRSLGRFYNMRAVEGDDSKAKMQVRVYEAHLGDTPVEEMNASDFVAWSFYQLGVILSLRNDGRLLAALSSIEDLEEALAQRAAREPANMEFRALAGNFAFFFAGNLPFGKEDRVEQGVAHFLVLAEHWDELRPGAKDPEHCPNTYENFMFELAEGLTVLERLDEARAVYGDLARIRPPRTRAKEQIAYVAQERLQHLDAYAGDEDLMPPWPSDVGNCVVCHAYTSDVPLTTLHAVERITLDDIPTQAVPKPVPVGELPSTIRTIVDERCVPCHRPEGEASEFADFTSDEGLVGRAGLAAARVEAGEMPPDRSLPDDERRALLHWLKP